MKRILFFDDIDYLKLEFIINLIDMFFKIASLIEIF